MNKNKYQTLFRVTQRDFGSIASSPCPAIFADRRVHIPITLIVFIIYVLFKIKLYLLLVHCLFERFVNMYLFSLFFNYHTCCALVLLFGTNCLYECWNNCQLFAIRHAWYNALFSAAMKLWNRCLFDRQFCLKPPYLYGWCIGHVTPLY